MTEVPTIVSSAFAKRGAARTPEEQRPLLPGRVIEGDLRVMGSLAHEPAVHRIGLVRRVDTADEFVEVFLVHSAPELATDHDIVLPAALTSAPYDAVVQTDLRGVVWTFQLQKRVGHLTELETIRAAHKNSELAGPAALGDRTTGIFRGFPLAGPIDRRWAFKESEGVAFRALTADCTEALLDQEFAWEVDPGLLQPSLLDFADDPELLLIELLHWAQTRCLSLTDDDLELLNASGALEVDTWSRFSDLGTDLRLGLQEVLLRAATGVGSEVQSEVQCMLTASHLGTTYQNASHDQIHYLAAKEPVTL